MRLARLRLLTPTGGLRYNVTTVSRNTSTICVNTPHFKTHTTTTGSLRSVGGLYSCTRRFHTGIRMAIGAVVCRGRVRSALGVVTRLSHVKISTLLLRSVNIL